MAGPYIAIDLKSFYASVECVLRGMDPLDTNLVVADRERSDKTICLAVSPGLKAHGIPGRPRLFEVVQQVQRINADRRQTAPGHRFRGKSVFPSELKRDPSLELDYIVATPQMAKYIQTSTRIYRIYLRYVAAEDIHVYSIDEVFVDVGPYLKMARCSARTFAERMVQAVLAETGITATVGIGTNLYLSKVAMDILAKKAAPDAHGVRIAALDEYTYRKKLWNHLPLTDFWRIGTGTVRRLSRLGLYTMGDICRASLCSAEPLYRMFGINAELLIDHAWGYEPCTMEAIRNYRPQNRSFSSGQVLQRPYSNGEARLVAEEMADELALRMQTEGMIADQLVLHIGYDHIGLQQNPNYRGRIKTDYIGREVPESAHGTENLDIACASSRVYRQATGSLFDRITDVTLPIRRMNLSLNHIRPQKEQHYEPRQLSLFPEESDAEAIQKTKELQQEEKRQQAVIDLKKRYGKAILFRGSDLLEGATAIERYHQIGGHKA